MNGKSKCKILKQIRQQIADSNDIPFVVSECRYQGDCKGTCPRCEEELRYLESELAKRQALGKAIVAAGLAATLAVTSAGCTNLKEEIEDILQMETTAGIVPADDIGDFQ